MTLKTVVQWQRLSLQGDSKMKYLILLTIFLVGCGGHQANITVGQSHDLAFGNSNKETVRMVKVDLTETKKLNDDWNLNYGFNSSVFMDNNDVSPSVGYGIGIERTFEKSAIFVGFSPVFVYNGDSIDGFVSDNIWTVFTGFKYNQFFFGYLHGSDPFERGDGLNLLIGGWTF